MPGKLRQQYHFKKVDQDVLIWDICKLIEKSAALEVITIDLAEITELDKTYWYEEEGDRPTCRSVAQHAKLIYECDLSHPIILGADGSVMDGMHRVCKAFLEGKKSILARQFERTPEPDYRNRGADELPYE